LATLVDIWGAAAGGSPMGYGRTRMKNVPDLGKEAVVQKMRYEEARLNMEPLCDHCREKLTNIILPVFTDKKLVFQFGDALYRVERIT
jgi:hypothetical protein